MMQLQLKQLVEKSLLIIILCGMSACTSSQTTSLDDELLSETEFSEESVPTTEGDVALGEESFSEESFGEEDFEEFEFSDGSGATDEFGDGELDLDFEDFESTDPAQAQAKLEAQEEQDLMDELELDKLQAEDVVQTEEPPAMPEEPQFDELDLSDTLETPVAEEPAFEDAFAEEPVADFGEPLGPPSSTEITDIRYLANQAGGTVVIDASGPLAYESRFNPQSGQFVIEVNNAVLPEKLKRPYIMKDFSGSFGGINAYQAPGSGQVRIVVQLKPGFSEEPALQMEGTSLVVVPPTMSASSIQASNGGGGFTTEPAKVSGPLGARNLEEFLITNQKFYGKPISIQFRDADVRDVIGFISEHSGANIVMSDDVGGKISLKLRQVPWDQALVSVMRARGLGYVRQGNVIRVATIKELRDESRSAIELLQAQTENAPVKAKVIPINYADVETLQNQVKEFLSKDGRVVVDARSNSILITDRIDVLSKVEQIIGALDVQPNQVLIEGKIVEAAENFSSTVGIKWSATGSPLTLSQTGGPNGVPVELTPRLIFGSTGTTVQPNRIGVNFGAIDFLGNLDATLSLAEKDQTAKVISSPRVMVMNREKAEISQVGEVISIVTIESGGAGNLSTTENRVPVNLKLEVTPQITSDGSVIMDMNVIRQFAGAIVSEQTQSRPINTRSAKTKVLVKNGETAVIGGIYQVDESMLEEGVPLLKDIPILGWLFKSRSREKVKNELLIFLTPKILAASDQQRAASL